MSIVNSEGLKRLKCHLDFGEGDFQFIIVNLNSDSSELIAELKKEYQVRVICPTNTKELHELYHTLRWLSPALTSNEKVVVELLPYTEMDQWVKDLSNGLTALNMTRNQIRSKHLNPFIFIGPRIVMETFKDSAPDFFSIRRTVIEI